jgi:putative addiction module component (TIGR02574 family)
MRTGTASNGMQLTALRAAEAERYTSRRMEEVPRGGTIPTMKSKGNRLLAQAVAFPEASRAKLAGRLLDSLDAEEAEPALDEAWAQEVARRVRALEAGAVKTAPWSQVRRNLLRSRRETTRAPVSRRSSS